MRRFWLRVIALIGIAFVVLIFDGSVQRAPIVSVIPLFILIGLWYYFYRKMSHVDFFADEVFDCDTSLKVRRGKIEEMVPLTNISKVEVRSVGIDRISVHIAPATTLGQQIDFIPDSASQSKSWSLKLTELNRVAADLNARADRARGIGLV